jgi:hypothetical protein
MCELVAQIVYPNMERYVGLPEVGGIDLSKGTAFALPTLSREKRRERFEPELSTDSMV